LRCCSSGQLPQQIGGAERVEGFPDRAGAETLDQVRRRAQHQLPQHIGDRFELARKFDHRLGRRAR